MTFLVLYLFEVIFSANNYDPNNKLTFCPPFRFQNSMSTQTLLAPWNKLPKGHFTDHLKIEWNNPLFEIDNDPGSEIYIKVNVYDSPEHNYEAAMINFMSSLSFEVNPETLD